MAAVDPAPGRAHWVASPEAVAQQWISTAPFTAATRKAYWTRLSGWLGFCRDSGLDPWAVRTIHIERYVSTVPERSRPHYCSAIVSFYRWAHAQDFTPRDLSAGLRRAPKPRPAPGTWASPAELRRMLTIVDGMDADARALVTVLALTGMRVGEALGLDVEDVTPEAAGAPMMLRVVRKSRHADQLGVPGRVADAVEPLLSRRSTGPLLRAQGRRMTQKEALKIVVAVGEKAGCAMRITPHSLRRSFVTFARDLGVPDRDIMATTGHTTVGMLDLYDRARREHLGAASTRIADALGGED